MEWTIGKFFSGMLFVVLGFIMVWKANWLLRNFGSIPVAEKFLSSEGGSRLFYKLLGILFMILGMMYATGLLEPVVVSIAKKLFTQI